VYQSAWHVPTAKSLYIFPIAEGGHGCILPSGEPTQALLQHVDKCMRHEDVVKKYAYAISTQIGRVALQLIH